MLQTGANSTQSSSPQTHSASDGVHLSKAAVTRLRALQEQGQGAFFRVSVESGGCSGFQYLFSFCEAKEEEDRIFTQEGVQILVDEVSLSFLQGAEIDFQQELGGSQFVIHNPQAKSGCSCGASFSP